MQIFITLDDEHRLQELIKQQFDMSLPIEGGWGYTQEKATIIQSLDNIPLKQFQHTFASMRAYGEMNMALPEAERYGSINVNELSGETIKIDNLVFEKILYEVSAMKESDYSDFINAYKEGYGKESFNMETHFQRRKEATLKREVTHWFNVTELQQKENFSKKR